MAKKDSGDTCEVNCKRFMPCVLAGFAFIFGMGFIVHHILLNDIYMQTPELWRTEEAMQETFLFMLLMQFLFVGVAASIFVRNYEDKGIGEGVRFGTLLGALLAVLYAMTYAYMPISASLAAFWALDGFVSGLGLGVIFSLIYKNKA